MKEVISNVLAIIGIFGGGILLIYVCKDILNFSPSANAFGLMLYSAVIYFGVLNKQSEGENK